MATQFELDCALMAGASYFDTRASINRFPIPDGWEKITDPDSHYHDTSSGFEAISFQRGDEIVISYAGTNPNSLLDPDNAANVGLATGFGSEQLLQAAEYYLQIKAANASNPNATITLTGHSLGGGLAALVGVFFGEKAVTFDQAPFANTAEDNLLTPDVAANLKSDLLLKGYIEDDLVGLTNYLQQRDTDGGIPNSGLVTNIRVDGEFTSSLPVGVYDSIGTPATVLDHGPYSHPSIDLHSMALLTAFLQSEQASADGGNPEQTLSEVSKELTDLLGMLFNSELYARETDPNTTEVNFLEHLIQHQEGLDPSVANDGDAMLARFTSDLWKIAQGGGLTMANEELTKALTAFAMQKYYEEPASGADHGLELFSEVTGGIRFNRMDVADTLDGDTGAKGYNKYFIYYLATLPQDEREAILQKLPDLLDWYIQAGSEGMTATAGNERAFMLGGDGVDYLTGGSQADVLVGNGGGDTLSGGAGADLMIGGEGVDSYFIEGNDSIWDSGSNRIYYQGQLLAGAFVREYGTNNYRFMSDNNITLTFNSSGYMTLNGTDSVTFAQQTSAADFENGDFGIRLVDSVEATYVLTGADDQNSMYMLSVPEGVYYGFSGSISGLGVRNGNILEGAWQEFKFSLYAAPPSLYIDGNGGDDFLSGLTGKDLIMGGTGGDIIIGDGFWMPSWGNTGDDDILKGGSGRDLILGNANLHGDRDDLVSDGDDLISGGEDSDFLDGGFDNDIINGDQGDDLVIGGSGDDQLFGGEGNDCIYGDEAIKVRFEINGSLGWAYPGATNTLSFHIGYNDMGYVTSIIFNGFEVLEVPGGGNDFLAGGDGDDYLNGGLGDDILMGEAGNDTLIGGGGADYLEGGEDNDLLIGDNGDGSGTGNDSLQGGAGRDRLQGCGGDDLLDGGNDDDILIGGDGNDTLSGGGGNDLLFGDAGNDVLDGGSGSDQLTGGEGNDVYCFSRGGGQDIISDSGGLADIIRFSDISADKVTVTREQGNIRIVVVETGDSLVIKNGLSDDSYKIEWLEFADGTIWSAATLESKITVPPVYPGTILMGGAGTDILRGGRGNDFIYGEGGSDYILGYEGNDYLSGGAGQDAIYGGAGDDWLFGGGDFDLMYGGDDNDILDGGPGGASLQGGAGNDVYLFGKGNSWTNVYDYDSTPGNVDTVRLGPGVTPYNVWVFRDFRDYNLYLSLDYIGEHYFSYYNDPNWNIGNEKDIMAMGDWHSGAEYRIERVEFADGTVWDEETLWAKANTPTSSADRIDIFEGYGAVNGLGGNDWIFGQGGNDIIFGGSGNDILVGGDGNDILDGGVGADELKGGKGDDILDGGANDSEADWMNGGAGNDVYLFGPGSGHDLVYDYDSNGGGYNPAINNVDTVRMAAGVAPGDVMVSGDDSNIYLSLNNGADRMTLGNWFLDDRYKIERVEFVDGTVWNGKSLLAMAQGPTEGDDRLEGTAGDDVIDGLGGNDQIYGLDGDDTLYGGEANDILEGGAGNDLLIGGDGDDTYLFNPGDGVDRITDSGGTDTIQFGAGITPDSLSLGLGSLLVRVGDQGEAIHLEGFNPDDPLNSSVIETFRFADGTVMGIGDLLARGFDIQGSNGDDLLIGTAVTDRIMGGEGADTLIGGKGDDLLSGGNGSDTYVFNPGDGVDTIVDISSATEGNLIAFGAGITAGDLTIERDGGDLLIRVGSQGDIVRLKDFDRFGNNGSLVADTLQFADGSQASLFQLTNTAPVVGVMLQDQIATEDAALSFTIPDDAFTDVDAGDSLAYTASLSDGSALPSWLNFDAATSTFSGMPTSTSAGLWDVRVMATDKAGAWVSDDFVLDVANHLAGTKSDSSLFGTSLRDVIEGTAGDNILLGYEGNDYLTGGTGDDTLIGGVGDDILDGGEGDDTYIFNSGDGEDTISYCDTKGFDTISFGADISQSGIGLFRNGNNLDIGYSDIDKVSIGNFFSSTGYQVDEVNLSDGSCLTAADINQIIQDMVAYAVNEGIALTSVNDVRNNEQLMSIVAGSWHA